MLMSDKGTKEQRRLLRPTGTCIRAHCVLHRSPFFWEGVAERRLERALNAFYLSFGDPLEQSLALELLC